MNVDILNAMGFGEAVERAKRCRCPLCNTPVRISEFKDDLSLKEFTISGMCQACQDGIFKPEPEE